MSTKTKKEEATNRPEPTAVDKPIISDAAQSHHADGAADSDLAQVRELLFGPQLRAQQSDITQLDSRLSAELQRLRDEMLNYVQAVEKHVKAEFAVVVERIQTEQAERAAAIRSVTDALQDLGQKSQRQYDELTKKLASAEQQTRENLQRETERFRQEMAAGQAELQQLIARETEQVRESATDRVALSDLFQELSARIKPSL